jgi:MinD-like ATPase involved in chromosome partitioning or flagellar assembly
MKVVAFYSYKGGVGRTLAAANFAVYLVKLGLKVVIMDFDLDAPGVDSKFPTYALPQGQAGLIDYILQFQRHGTSPGPVADILCTVPISSPRQEYALWLIPAGDYFGADYAAKLNELDWRRIFSDQRDGVAFFQEFLRRINEEVSPDVLIIDSRTGFSEIGGLCTQQLADETVIMSSLASESVKMTRRLARVVRESRIAKSLDKEVETKVVVCRVPKPKDIDKLKVHCCKQFGVDETRLFFLFSCPGLEREEFVAMCDTSKEDTLVANYIQLFHGLDVEIAQESIGREIASAERGILSCPPKEVEARIREMVALYPHPEVYRRAMRFFDLTQHPEEAFSFGLRLLDLVSDDVEAQSNVTRFLLQGEFIPPHGFISHISRRPMEGVDMHRLVSIAERVYRRGELTLTEKIRLADVLAHVNQHELSYEVIQGCLEMEIEDAEMRLTAISIAVRTAMRLGKTDAAAGLISKIPTSRLRGGLAVAAIQLKVAGGDKEGAFGLAREVLSRDMNPSIVEQAIQLSHELGRLREVEEAIRVNPELENLVAHNPQLCWHLERLGIDLSDVRERASSSSSRHRRLQH